MSEIFHTGSEGERLLADYLRGQGRSVEPSAVKTFDLLPIVVTAIAGRLDDVRRVVEERGSVRHVLEPLDAVSAWLSLSSVTELAALDSVRTLELAQAMQLAT